MEKNTVMPTKEEIEKEAIDPSTLPLKLTWIRDEYGTQGVTLFTGKVYWLVKIDEKTGRFLNYSLTPEEWKSRNEDLAKR